MLSVNIGDIDFEGELSGSTGYLIDPEGWSGWDEGTTVRRQEVVRPAAHGAFDTPGFLAPRVITISGWIIGSSAGSLRTLRRALTGLLADGESGTLTVDNGISETWAVVRLAGQTQVSVRGATETEARFQISFWAPDPRKYGPRNEFGPDTSVGASHNGNVPAYPELVVNGTATGYTITGPDSKQIVVTQNLEPGAPHKHNLATGAFYVDGIRTVGGRTTYEPWTVPADGFVTASTSAGDLEIWVYDTYM